MKLHTNETLFKQAVQRTADQLQIPAIFVEKDYWVTYLLHSLFNKPIGHDLVFKGGTALQKCFNVIERFSEDLDLAILRREGETDNRLKAKLKTVSALAGSLLPEIEVKSITHKMGMNRKTVHSYQKSFSGAFGHVLDVIVLETTWLGHPEPFITQKAASFVGQMLLRNGQSDYVKVYDLDPFELKVLDPRRTICEKIMSLVRFSYSQYPLEDLKKKIRHTYDLHQLLGQVAYVDFLQTPAFEQMLLKVAYDDMLSFKNNNRWLIYHPKEAFFFKSLETIWPELKTVYINEFQFMVFGLLPNESSVLASMKMIRDRLTSLTWFTQDFAAK